MASMKRFVAVLLLLSLLVCLGAQAQTAETIKIGAFLSLTGATASYGVSALNAIKLATEEANRAGGINGKQIELVVEDDHSNTQEVPGIVTRLIKDPKVHALLAEFTKLGGEIRGQQTYGANDPHITAQFIAMTAMNPDLIFAPGFYTTAPLIARTMKQSGIKATLIGSDGWDSPDLMKGGAEPFAGVYFANHFWVGSNDPIVKKFVNDYQAKYGVIPDAGGATAYDAARLLFDAFKRANSIESQAVRDALAASKDFPGVTGKITIDAQRNAQVPVYMLRIDKNGKFSLQ